MIEIMCVCLLFVFLLAIGGAILFEKVERQGREIGELRAGLQELQKGSTERCEERNGVDPRSMWD